MLTHRNFVVTDQFRYLNFSVNRRCRRVPFSIGKTGLANDRDLPDLRNHACKRKLCIQATDIAVYGKRQLCQHVSKIFMKTILHLLTYASKFASFGNGAVAEESKLLMYLSSSKDCVYSKQMCSVNPVPKKAFASSRSCME